MAGLLVFRARASIPEPRHRATANCSSCVQFARPHLTQRGAVRVGPVVDDGGEPHIQACEDDVTVPDGPAEFTIDPLSDDDAEHDYESPAFLRRAK